MAFALEFVAVAFAWAFFGWNAPADHQPDLRLRQRLRPASVPMFILMALIMDRSGVAQDLFKAVSVWAGGMPGGVGLVTMITAVLAATRRHRRRE